MDETRFNSAVARALLRRREGGGIGMLGEKTLHSALKYYYEPNELSHEQSEGGYLADIKNEDGIIEVQTGSLGALRNKLAEYIKTVDVTVVHPIIRKKTIVWIDPRTGRQKRSHSSRCGRLEDAFLQIMHLGALPRSPRLKIALPILDIEETRLMDGRDFSRKKGATKLDKIPTALIDEAILTCAEDYLYFIPQKLLTSPQGFTVKMLLCAKDYKDPTARAVLYTLLNMHLLERERHGHEYVYTLTEEGKSAIINA